MADTVLGDGDPLAPHVGTEVTLRGVITRTKIPTLCGVDIDDAGLAGELAEATGVLEASTTTRAELDALIARVGQVATRGPGTSYRLVDDGRLARARRV